jgi:PAS domain S-box-containing protein
MNTRLNQRLLDSLPGWSRTIGLILVSLGCIVLVGWQFNIAELKSILPGLATMKANTAIGFLFAGLALLLENKQTTRSRLFVIRMSAGIVALLGLFTLGEYIFDTNLGIDQLLYRDLQTPTGSYPGRMSITTALNFGLLGIALLLIDVESKRGIRPAQFLALIATAIASTALIGYLYGVESLYSIGAYSSMALPTALGFAAFTLGVLFARPQAGWMDIVSSEAIGGVILRRFIPFAIILPVVLGWLRLWGERAGFYDSNFGLALMVILSVVFLSVIIWLNAQWLNEVESERRQAEFALQGSESVKAGVLESALDCIITINHQGRIIEFNPAAQATFGYSLQDVLGREIVQLIIPPAFREQHRLGLNRYLTTGESRILGKRIEMPALRADGSQFPVELTITRVADSDPPVFTGFLRDITKRKQAEEALRERERQLTALITSLDDIIFEFDEQGTYLNVWTGDENMLAQPKAQLLGRRINDVLGEENGRPFSEAVKRVLVSGRSEIIEYPLQVLGGQRWFMARVSPIFAQDMPQRTASMLIRDITDQKRATESLRETEEYAQSLLRLSRRLERAQMYSEALAAALDEVKVVVGFQNIWIYLLSEDRQQFRLLTTTGGKSLEIADDFPSLTIKGDSFLEEIVEGRDIVVVEDARIDPRTNKDIVAQLGNRTIVNVPIRLMERHLGAFGTGSFGDEGVHVPTSTQLDYLRALASHMAVTLDRIQLLNERRQAEEKLRRLNEELEHRVAERTQQLKRLNQELEDYGKEIQSIFDSMTTLNAKVAPDGRLLLVNKIAAQASGLSLDELMKTNFLEGPWWAFDMEVQNRVRDAFAQARSGTAINYDEKIFVFGQVLNINFSLTPMLGNDERVEYILAEARDITRLKEVEETLQARTAQLEAANQELDAFSYSVSHDLRAPLRSIDGFSQALLEDYGQQLPVDGRGYLERIRKAAQHMAALIDDLLNLSRVTRAPMQTFPVDLSKLARAIAMELQSTQSERKAKFKIAPDLKVRGDTHLLRAVLQNLLSNAWKYTSKREQAEIEFGSKQEGDAIIYFVRDNGAGFNMMYAGKLFSAFQRLHAAADFPGTGVGLATVQRILHRHGGRIWAEAEVDRGATFFFTLPTSRAGRRVTPHEKDTISRRAKQII